jgi:AAA domain
MTGTTPAIPQDGSATRPANPGVPQFTDWVPILICYEDGTFVAGAWGSGDPDTIPEEFFELPEELADGDGEEILEPPFEAENEAEMPKPVAKSVPEKGGGLPFRPPMKSRFRPLTLSEMADLPPPKWLINGLVPEDGLVVLYGEPGAGKSFLALDWGLSVATGVPWAGREVSQGEVVYIYAEGIRGLTQRAAAWRQEHGCIEAPLFRAVPVAVRIPDPGERSEFVRAIRSVCRTPRLIIIDTLARNFGDGNESAAQDMNAFVDGCEELRVEFPGATVLVVHHPGKDQKRGARGSLALLGAAQASFALTRSGDALTLKNEKQKDGEEAQPIPLELARVTLPDENTSRAIRSTKGGSSGGPAPSKPRKDPRTVETDARTLAALAGFGPAGTALAEWQRAAGRAKGTFYNSRDRLVAAGKVLFDAETAHYVVVKEKPGPGPEQVQNRLN